MDFKNLILTIFLLFLLNFSVPLNGQFQPGKEKHLITFTVSIIDNDAAESLIKKNKKALFSEFISCYLQINMINKVQSCFNTS